MGSGLSKADVPDGQQVGSGKSFVKGHKEPAGTSWLYPLTNPIIKYLLAPIHYWTFYQGCGPFSLSGCDDLMYVQYMVDQWVPESTGGTAGWPRTPTSGMLKFFWVAADIIGFAAIFAILVIGGFILTQLAFIPEFIYDIFSLIEGLLSPLISVLSSVFGYVLGFFESMATYVLQFLGISGDFAGQSILGIVTDVAGSLNGVSGVPTILWYTLLGEGLVYALLEIAKDAQGGGLEKNWNCLFKKLFKTMDFPFYFLTTKVFATGFIHYFLGLMFLPFRVVFYITTILLGTVWCDVFKDDSCSNYSNCEVPPPIH